MFLSLFSVISTIILYYHNLQVLLHIFHSSKVVENKLSSGRVNGWEFNSFADSLFLFLSVSILYCNTFFTILFLLYASLPDSFSFHNLRFTTFLSCVCSVHNIHMSLNMSFFHFVVSSTLSVNNGVLFLQDPPFTVFSIFFLYPYHFMTFQYKNSQCFCNNHFT